MIPVMQTILAPPTGNCMAACVASLLERPLWTVPNFCVPNPRRHWWDRYVVWLDREGYYAINFDVSEKGFQACAYSFELLGALCIVTGTSPRATEEHDYNHCVVGRLGMRDGKIEVRFVHDPSPLGGWIKDLKAVDLIIPKGALS